MKSGGPSYPNPLSSPPRWSPWDLFKSFKVCSDTKERVGCGKQREATAPIKSLLKLQLWFLSLRWKTSLPKNCSLGFSACREGPAFGENTLMMMIVSVDSTFQQIRLFEGCGKVYKKENDCVILEVTPEP